VLLWAISWWGGGGLGLCDEGFSTWDGMMVWIWKGGETFLTLVLWDYLIIFLGVVAFVCVGYLNI